MKIFGILIFTLMIITSCEPRVNDYYNFPAYEYTKSAYVPDSNKVKMAVWITETVKASNNHMTGGDYEDPEDVIEQCEETAQRLFSIETEGLTKYTSPQSFGIWYSKEQLTKRELQILDSLKNSK